MDPTVIPSSSLLLQLAALLTGDFAAATVHLFTNDVNPGKSAVVGDFTAATFVGSTAIAIGAWGEVFLNGDLDAEAIAPLMQWDYDSGTAETVYGVYVLSAGVGTPLIAYARLETPKEMATTEDSLVIVPRLVFSATGFGSFATLSA